MNDAADETQQEYFTQIEEQRITRERVERFVEHQYFALAYVMRVTHLSQNYGDTFLKTNTNVGSFFGWSHSSLRLPRYAAAC